MNMRILVVLALFFTLSVEAKKPNVAIFYDQYLSASGQPYIETYFSLDPLSVNLTLNEQGNLQGGIKILLLFEQEGEIVAYDKMLLLTPEIGDTLAQLPYALQASRLALDPGNYTMKIEIVDLNQETNPITLNHEMQVQVDRSNLSLSNILILDSYKQATEKNANSKWGYELIPIVPIGTYYIPEQLNTLPFYMEIANADSVLGQDEQFITRYYIFDNTRKIVLNKYAGFQKLSAATVNPVLNAFAIDKLPSGYYTLTVEVISKNNELLKTQKLPFYRSNPAADANEFDLSLVSLGTSFVTRLNNPDSLVFYVDCLYPTSTDSERRVAKNVLSSNDVELMQRYFLMFWNKRDPVNPEIPWMAYKQKVHYSQREFGSKSTPGYRTDMGRVLLQYGQPTTIERSFNDPSNYPWQIWQYDVLESPSTPMQNNRMFVFVDQALAGRNYVLIHSTGLGEIQDFKWQYALSRNTNRGQNVDDGSRPDGRDDFGYRVNNNFIIGDHRYWGDR